MSIATDILNGGPLGVTQFSSAIFAPFSSQLSFGFMPGLRLPRVGQWNAAVERALGANDAISLGYLGSAGRYLVRREIDGLDDASDGSRLNQLARLDRGFHLQALAVQDPVDALGLSDRLANYRKLLKRAA